MISRYLVINGDLLCNAFTLQSAWIHYKGNRYHLTGISVSDDQNCGIHQNGFAVLRFRNSGSESPGILSYILTSAGDYLKDYTFRFEKALSKYHIPHVYQYMRNKQLQHDFPVMDTNAIESKDVIVDIANTFKRYFWESESTSAK